jgi:antitoxin PrlF
MVIQEQRVIKTRPLKPDARRIRGVLKSPHAKAPTVAQMDEAVSKLLRDKHAPSQTRGRR